MQAARAKFDYADLIIFIDQKLERLGQRLSKSTRVAGMGAFHYPNHKHWFIDLWRDAGGWTLRLGRTELNLDMKAPSSGL